MTTKPTEPKPPKRRKTSERRLREKFAYTEPSPGILVIPAPKDVKPPKYKFPKLD